MSFFTQGFRVTFPSVTLRCGPGARHEIDALMRKQALTRALVLSTPEQAQMAENMVAALGGLAVGSFTRARMHTPTDVTAEAVAEAHRLEAGCVVAVGGGSTTGLAKAIAWHTDLDQIIVPTTYAGSEATSILGQTENGEKRTFSDPRVQPEHIVYDPELVAGLPADMTVTSALNAIAHAAEALYARERNPITTLLAIEGIRAFVDGLPAVRANPADLGARTRTLYGAWLCGTVLSQVGMSLHHKLCHTLGGSLDLPHAQIHAILLPHAIAYNEPAAAAELTPLRDLFGAQSAAAGLYGFARTMGAPLKLADLGASEADLDRVADLAARNAYWNPRPVERHAIRALLGRAWAGEAPAA